MKKLEKYRQDVYKAIAEAPAAFTSKDIVAVMTWPMAEESIACQVRHILNELLLIGLIAQLSSTNKLVTMYKTQFFAEDFIPNPLKTIEL